MQEATSGNPVSYSTKFNKGRHRPVVQTITLLCNIFDSKDTETSVFIVKVDPIHIISVENGTLFQQ